MLLKFDLIYSLSCQAKNQENLKKKIAENKKKCLKVFKEVCGLQSYMSHENISEVRKFFKTRTGMLPFAANYPGDLRFARTRWLCGCGEREEEEHILEGRCPLYSDLRAEYGDLARDEELVAFFSQVLQRREQLAKLTREEEEQEEQERATVSPKC